MTVVSLKAILNLFISKCFFATLNYPMVKQDDVLSWVGNNTTILSQ